MSNQSIYAGFERMWYHVLAALGNKANSDTVTNHINDTNNPHNITAEQVGADTAGTAQTLVDTHDSNTSAHSDIRELINGLSASSDLTSHTNNKSNPHEVTATQVGLGNVPNVTTNNQTPTYTASSTLTALSSGEILSTAFGKIAKAVSDLIAHLANTSNPHSVTAAQVGLGNVDNTSDANKPVSTAQQTAIDNAVSGLASTTYVDDTVSAQISAYLNKAY